MTDFWSADFCVSESWNSLASDYTNDLLDFLCWISEDDLMWKLWQFNQNRLDDRNIHLLLDFSGCLDAKL